MKNILVWFAGILADEIKKRLLEADVKVAVLNLQPGDKIILRYPRRLSGDVRAHLTERVEELFPGHQAVVLEEGMEIGVARIEERLDDAEPGIAEGTFFYCQFCEATVLDSWVTRADIGYRVKCPTCKRGFNVISRNDETNTVLVQP